MTNEIDRKTEQRNEWYGTECLERIADAVEELPSDTALLAAVILSGAAMTVSSEDCALRASVRAVEMARLVIYLSGQSAGVRTAGEIINGENNDEEVRRDTLRKWVRRHSERGSPPPV